MTQLQLEVLTPEKVLLNTQADWITLPGSEGELGILPNHVPLLTTLDSGALVFEVDGKTTAVAVHWGYAHVDNDKVSILAELAESSSDIDKARAQAAYANATEVLAKPFGSDDDEQQRLNKYEAKLKRAITRIKASKSK